jgi:hypothetical protein
MNLEHPDLAAILLHVADQGAQGGVVTHLLTQLGLDPNEVTVAEVVHRLEGAAWAAINLANVFALLGALFYVATLLMRTIVPLRVSALISCAFFVLYGALANSVTTLILYILLLPINSVRLHQIIKLVKRARMAAEGDLSMDWLKPFMTHRKYRKGDVLFRKNDPANELFYTVSGLFLVTEIGVELAPGRLMGELGFLSPNSRRTQTVECTESGEVMTISYDRLLELYFQNPEFGYYLLRLSSERLLQNVARLEAIIEQSKAAPQADAAKGAN